MASFGHGIATALLYHPPLILSFFFFFFLYWHFRSCILLGFFLHSFCFLASLHHLLNFRWLARFSFLLPDFLEIISLLMIPIFTLY